MIVNDKDKKFFMKSLKPFSRFNLCPFHEENSTIWCAVKNHFKVKPQAGNLKKSPLKSYCQNHSFRRRYVKWMLKFKFVFFPKCQSRNAIMKHERGTFRKKIKNTSRQNGWTRSRRRWEKRKRCPTESLFSFANVLLSAKIKMLDQKMMALHVRKSAFMRETIMINLYLTWLLLLSPWPSSCFD